MGTIRWHRTTGASCALPPPRRSLAGGLLLFAGAVILPGAPEFDPGLFSPAIRALPVTGSVTRDATLPPAAGLGLSLPSPFGWALDPTAAIAADAEDGAAAAGENPAAQATIAAPRLRRAPAGKLHLDCAFVPQRLQSGGEYWQTLPYAAMPARLTRPARVGSALPDPIRGPSGNRTNLQAPAPAGAWCRPPPIPFAETSPLANRSFWIPAGLLLFGVGVFWLSRGLALPP